MWPGLRSRTRVRQYAGRHTGQREHPHRPGKSHPGQPPETARITAASTPQRLYHAILALPLAPQGNIYADSSPAYQLVFHAADQTIPSVISQKLSLVSLEGHFQSRGGTYTMNEAFKRLLKEILSGATFAPAR